MLHSEKLKGRKRLLALALAAAILACGTAGGTGRQKARWFSGRSGLPPQNIQNENTVLGELLTEREEPKERMPPSGSPRRTSTTSKPRSWSGGMAQCIP